MATNKTTRVLADLSLEDCAAILRAESERRRIIAEARDRLSPALAAKVIAFAEANL